MLSAALLALILTGPRQVTADAARDAEMLAHRSALEYDLGHAEEALRDIEHAYLLDPLPGLLFNLGQCHRRLQHWKQAEEAYLSFLHHRPDAPNRELVLKLIDEMEREQVIAEMPELGQRHPPPAPLQGEPGSAPQPPAPARAPPAPLPDSSAARAPASRPPAAPVATASAPAPTTAPPAATRLSTEEPPPSSKASAWPWAFAATAAVAAGFSVVGFAQMVSYSSLQSSSSPKTPTPVTEALSAAQSYAWGEPVGIAGAAVAALSVGGLAWTW